MVLFIPKGLEHVKHIFRKQSHHLDLSNSVLVQTNGSEDECKAGWPYGPSLSSPCILHRQSLHFVGTRRHYRSIMMSRNLCKRMFRSPQIWYFDRI